MMSCEFQTPSKQKLPMITHGELDNEQRKTLTLSAVFFTKPPPKSIKEENQLLWEG